MPEPSTTKSYLDGTITLLADHSLKLSLEVLRPTVDRQLRDLNGGIVELGAGTDDIVLVVADLLDRAAEAAPPRKHGFLLFVLHQAVDVGNDVFRVVCGNRRAPT